MSNFPNQTEGLGTSQDAKSLYSEDRTSTYSVDSEGNDITKESGLAANDATRIEGGFDVSHSSNFDMNSNTKERGPISQFLHAHWKNIFYGVWFCLLLSAMIQALLPSNRDEYGFSAVAPFLGVTLVVFLHHAKTLWGSEMKAWWMPYYDKMSRPFEERRNRKIGLWCFIGLYLCLLAIFTTIAMIKTKEPSRLQGLGGMAFIVILLYGFSTARRQVRWRSVVGGLTFQLVLGFVVLQTKAGFDTFSYAAEKFSTFLAYVNVGAAMVFGEGMVATNLQFASEAVSVLDDITGEKILTYPIVAPPMAGPAYTLMYFATVVCTTVMFFAGVVALCYYIGALQPAVKGIAFVYRKILGTSMPESINSAGNMFLGQTEAPLLIKPFLKDMTDSEIHAVMTGGFATVAGAVMGSYMSMGIPAGHLLTSTAMSAPVSLAFSKLKHPETTKSPASDPEVIREALYSGNEQYNNVIEAICSAVSDAIFLSLNIGAMVFVFMSLISFFDDIVAWLFYLQHITVKQGDGRVTLTILLGYILSPLCFLLGVPWEDSITVGSLIGTKVVVNEFVAYAMLGEYMANNASCAADPSVCDSLVTLGPTATTITSYALCGFGNLGSMGIQIGGLTPLAPEKRRVFTSLCVSALVTGCLCNMFNGALAGLLEDPARVFGSF